MKKWLSAPAAPNGTLFHARPTPPPKETIMSDLTHQFETAVANSKELSQRPDNATLLKLYALYKQATAGDAEGERPGFADMVARAKWDAWNALKGTAREASMQHYIDLVDSLE
jgi:acyl-CoA-binding protein